MELRLVLLLAFVLSLGVACSSEPTAGPTPTPSVQTIGLRQHSREIGLLPEVYHRIDAMTDCAELQEAFDASMTLAELREPSDSLRSILTNYAQYIHDRMSEIGCPQNLLLGRLKLLMSKTLPVPTTTGEYGKS